MGSYIDHICTTNRTEFIASYLEITCVHYILLNNRDLQSYQVEQGNDVAITSPAQSTLCILGHQSVPRLATCLDSTWHTPLGESDQKRIIWFGIQIARQCFQRSTWNVLPRVTTNWSLNTLPLNIIWENFQQNYKPMKLQLSVPELLTSAPYGGDIEGTVHMERTGECKLLNSSHHKSSSQRMNWHLAAHWQGRHDAVMNRTDTGPISYTF